MNDPQDRLTEEESERILREQIIPDFQLDAVRSHERPRAFVLAVQPGVGVAGMANRILQELQGDAVLIDPDELSDYHPRIRELRAESPWEWSERTDHDAIGWGIGLLLEASARKKNLILDLSSTDGTLLAPRLVRGLEERGYEVDVRAFSAHRLESELGIEIRFSDGMKREGYGRRVSKEVHDMSYAQLPRRLDEINSGR